MAPPGSAEMEHEICVGSEDNDAKRGTVQKHNVSTASSEDVPLNFEGATPAQGGDPKHCTDPAATTKTESGSGHLLGETMVGWRTLPPENEVTRRRGGGGYDKKGF